MEQCNLFEPWVPNLSNEDNTVSAEIFQLLSEVEASKHSRNVGCYLCHVTGVMLSYVCQSDIPDNYEMLEDIASF